MAASNHSVGIAHLTVVPRNATVTGEDEKDGDAEADAEHGEAETDAERGDVEAADAETDA